MHFICKLRSLNSKLLSPFIGKIKHYNLHIKRNMNGYVVCDCDPGTDDAWALYMLIRGEAHFNKSLDNAGLPGSFKILGITCVHGNTTVDNATRNTLRLLKSVDRLDIPVYKGADLPILTNKVERKSYFHGKDGFGDIEHNDEYNDENVVNRDIQKEHAAIAMYQFVCKYPKMVDFILLGPLTNFALCINLYGEKFLEKIRRIYIMGGNCRGKGNITKCAEFNFMMDPEAAHIVLKNIESRHIVTILPWETCIDSDLGTTQVWRFNVLGRQATNDTINLLNRVEWGVLKHKGFTKWVTCDAILVAAYLFPHLVITHQRLYHVAIELSGTHTRGQMVLDHLRRSENNVTIIMGINRECYRHVITWTAGLEDIKTATLLREIS